MNQVELQRKANKILGPGLKYNEESLTYVTSRFWADKLKQYIKTECMPADKCKQMNILDMTACIGSDTIEFATYFKHVYSVELTNKFYDMLLFNVRRKHLKNVTVYNADSDSLLFNFDSHNIDVVYIDPPWGGSSYSQSHELILKFGGLPMDEYVTKIFRDTSVKMVIL